MRLIDADALKNNILSWAVLINKPHLLSRKDTIYMFEGAPTIDAVPVIRCKHCQHQKTCEHTRRLGINGYCSDGERRETS